MSGATAVAVALSLVSAVAYATAAVAQERLAARTRDRTASGSGLLALLSGGAWWWAVALNAAGALLHVAALTYGPLTVVQPLGALTLVAAVPLGARRAGRRVGRDEWRGTACTLVGLAAILLTAAGAAPDEVLSLPRALGVAGVAMVLVGVLCRPGARPGLRHAAASGITSGVASALTQTVTVAATARGTSALPLWQAGAVALVVAAFASGGLLLSQRAYRGGLGAPLAVLTLANPVAAAVIGLSLLGERLQGGTAGAGAALMGAVVAARGVVLLTRAPVNAAPAPATVPGPRPGPVPVRGEGGGPGPSGDRVPASPQARPAAPPRKPVPAPRRESVPAPSPSVSTPHGESVPGTGPARAPGTARARRVTRAPAPGGTTRLAVPRFPVRRASVRVPPLAGDDADEVPEAPETALPPARRRVRRRRGRRFRAGA
ncbi:DMT family transporter [Streptomyces sp. NPDC095613]|uniref:DMT family transporter n=1 Tax=Streptomyces sp. NPDC095613 TaxID=3155540 RepID=UPI00332AFFF0